MAFSSTQTASHVVGDITIRTYTYSAASVTTGAITVPKGTFFVAWTPATVRASATITWTAAAGTLTLDGVTANDTGTVMIYAKGGV